MAWCLIKSQVEKFRQALKSGELNPGKLQEMTSEERRGYLAKFVGPENAMEVNALFESKLLLQNQKAGMISWAKKISGITPKTKMDLLSKIERMNEVLSPKEGEQFLQDLAETRLGIGVSQTEAGNIADLSKSMQENRAKADKDGIFPTETDRLSYGASVVDLENYVNNLKLEAKKISLIQHPVKAVIKGIQEIPGTLVSVMTSLDNSFFGRQGIKTLYTNPDIWTKAFVKSWGDIGTELKGKDAIDAIKADIYSRPNAMNGKYNAGKYGLDALTEEAYPSSIPERIPLLGRLFKASQSAYNGAALRMRSDLADRYIGIAEKQGINALDQTEAKQIGKMVSSLTGRGSLGKAEPLAKDFNAIFFSIKFLKSNFDTLTAHLLDKNASKFVKKEAAKNLLKIVGSIASLLVIAKLIDPESVDEDLRSTNFGKIKMWGQWVDVTGGMGGLVRLGARVATGWSKSGTGKWTNLRETGFGKRTVLDEMESFLEGKLSPTAGIIRDWAKGQLFGGEKFTWQGAIGNALTPMPLSRFKDLTNDPNAENIFASMILDGLGLSSSSVQPMREADWTQSTAKKYDQFKQFVGENKFKEANDKYNEEYMSWLNQITKSDKFKELSQEGQDLLKSDGKTEIENKVFKEYGFKYITPPKTPQQIDEEQKIKNIKLDMR